MSCHVTLLSHGVVSVQVTTCASEFLNRAFIEFCGGLYELARIFVPWIAMQQALTIKGNVPTHIIYRDHGNR